MSVGEFWPEKGVQKSEWTLTHRQNAPVALSGDSVVTDFGEPAWTVEVSIEVPIRSDLERQWSAFFRRRHGRKKTFTMNPSFRSFPGSGAILLPVDAEMTLARRTDGRTVIQNHGNVRVEEGDMFSFFTAQSGYFIGEIETLIASNVNSLQFELYPRPFEPNATTPAIRFVKPVGEFRLDGEPSVSVTNTSRGWNFTATQVIRG